MSIQKRIKQVRLESKQSQEQFSASIGMKRANYAQLELGKQEPAFDVLSAIVRIYNKTYEWLIDGKETKQSGHKPYPALEGKLQGKELGKVTVTEAGEKYINNLTRNDGGSNAAPGVDHVVDTTGLKLIPILDVKAAAGVTGYLNPDYIHAEDVIQLPTHMIKSGLHAAIRIKGPSMAPTLQDGGTLVIRYLDKGEWANMRSELVYFVVDTEGKSYIKRLKNRLIGEKGFIVCKSDNPDKVSHPNFNLLWEEIAHIWIAEWYLSAKMPNIHDTYFTRQSNLEDKVDTLEDLLRSIQKQLK